jgi:hypothetical protein
VDFCHKFTLPLTYVILRSLKHHATQA